MKPFFIPSFKREHWPDIEKAIIANCEDQLGHKVIGKVYSIDYLHNGSKHKDTVGEISLNNETVVMILETAGLFYTITTNAGFKRGEPMITHKTDTANVVSFDLS